MIILDGESEVADEDCDTNYFGNREEFNSGVKYDQINVSEAGEDRPHRDRVQSLLNQSIDGEECGIQIAKNRNTEAHEPERETKMPLLFDDGSLLRVLNDQTRNERISV